MPVSAFTDDEKASIRSYLGFSQLFFLIDPRLEGQMNTLPTSVPSSVTLVRAILVKLAGVDAALDNALPHLTLIKAEDITFLGVGELEGLRDQGRMLIGQMATIFQIQVPRDYYATGELGMGGIVPLG